MPSYIFRKTESENFKKVCMIKLLYIISLSYRISNTHLVLLGSVTMYTGTQMVELKHNPVLPPFCVNDASTLTFKRLLPYRADSNSYLSSLSIHERISPQPVHSISWNIHFVYFGSSGFLKTLMHYSMIWTQRKNWKQVLSFPHSPQIPELSKSHSLANTPYMGWDQVHWKPFINSFIQQTFTECLT